MCQHNGDPMQTDRCVSAFSLSQNSIPDRNLPLVAILNPRYCQKRCCLLSAQKASKNEHLSCTICLITSNASCFPGFNTHNSEFINIFPSPMRLKHHRLFSDLLDKQMSIRNLNSTTLCGNPDRQL